MREREGFTLLELMLALVLLGVAALGIVDLLSVTESQGHALLNREAALLICRERIEQLQNVRGLGEGTGSNPDGPFLPAFDKVCVERFGSLWLTESDYYAASDGTAPSRSALEPARRVDVVTQLRWVDDPAGGGVQDYLLATVTVVWRERGRRNTVSISRYVAYR